MPDKPPTKPEPKTKPKTKTSQTPPARRGGRPRIDAVLRHIRAGSYDDDIGQLQGAIDDRRRKLQEAVREMVKKTFGEEYDVAAPSPVAERPNPFIKKAQESGADPDLAAAEARARQEEERLRAEAEAPWAFPEDGEDDPDIESRSPIIGSVES